MYIDDGRIEFVFFFFCQWVKQRLCFKKESRSVGRISMLLLNELHKVAWYSMIEYRSPESCSCLKDTVSQMSFPPHICFGVQMLCLRCYMFLIYWTRLQARFISTCHHLAKLRSWYGRIRHMEKTTRKIAARLHLEINLRDAWSRNSLGLLESKWSLVSVSLAEQNIVSVCLCERSKSVSSLPCHLQHVPIFSWLGSFRFIQENDLDNELTNDSELFGHLRRCTSLAGPLRGRLCGFCIDIIDMGMGRGIAIYQLFWFWCSPGPGTRILTIPDHPRPSQNIHRGLSHLLGLWFGHGASHHPGPKDHGADGAAPPASCTLSLQSPSGPLDEKYPSWGLVWHPLLHVLLQWLLSQNQGYSGIMRC